MTSCFPGSSELANFTSVATTPPSRRLASTHSARRNRFDIPERLLPECWRKHTSGWETLGSLALEPSFGTIQTVFFKPEKGRYLHPTEDRAITHLEAALLQGFNPKRVLIGTKIELARQIVMLFRLSSPPPSDEPSPPADPRMQRVTQCRVYEMRPSAPRSAPACPGSGAQEPRRRWRCAGAPSARVQIPVNYAFPLARTPPVRRRLHAATCGVFVDGCSGALPGARITSEVEPRLVAGEAREERTSRPGHGRAASRCGLVGDSDLGARATLGSRGRGRGRRRPTIA